MRIFLSHASDDKPTAEAITFSLRNSGHKVFLDRDDLPAGEGYDQKIEKAVKQSDAFIFLVSPASVTKGRYTLTELSFARRRWPDPHGRVLPVLVSPTPMEDIPTYLKAVTLLEPLGNVTAETVAAVADFGRNAQGLAMALRFAIAGFLAGLIASFLPHQHPSIFGLRIFGFAPDLAIAFATATSLAAYMLAGITDLGRLSRLAFVWALIAFVAAANLFSFVSFNTQTLSASELEDTRLAEVIGEDAVASMKERIESTNSIVGAMESYIQTTFVTLKAIGLAAALAVGSAFVLGANFAWRDIFAATIIAFVGMVVLYLTMLLPIPEDQLFLVGSKEDSVNDGVDTFIIWSSPKLAIWVASVYAFSAAAVGHVLGRN
jgi:hypothetical protein